MAMPFDQLDRDFTIASFFLRWTSPLFTFHEFHSLKLTMCHWVLTNFYKPINYLCLLDSLGKKFYEFTLICWKLLPLCDTPHLFGLCSLWLGLWMLLSRLFVFIVCVIIIVVGLFVLLFDRRLLSSFCFCWLLLFLCLSRCFDVLLCWLGIGHFFVK